MKLLLTSIFLVFTGFAFTASAEVEINTPSGTIANIYYTSLRNADLLESQLYLAVTGKMLPSGLDESILIPSSVAEKAGYRLSELQKIILDNNGKPGQHLQINVQTSRRGHDVVSINSIETKK